MGNHLSLIPSLGIWAGVSSVENFVGSTTVQSCELRGMSRRVLELGCYCLVLESLRQNWCSVVVGLPPKVSNGGEQSVVVS